MTCCVLLEQVRGPVTTPACKEVLATMEEEIGGYYPCEYYNQRPIVAHCCKDNLYDECWYQQNFQVILHLTLRWLMETR